MEKNTDKFQLHAAARSEERDTSKSFEVIPGKPNAGLLIVCDHARNYIPEQYNNLGMDEAQLQRHIAYDIGVESVTRQMCEMINVPAVMTNYSRLLIDPNRGNDDPTLIMRLSDGAIVPGNASVDEKERQHRIETYHTPYHREIDTQIDNMTLSAGKPPALLSIHSFTDNWKGTHRPWHITVLWDDDERLVRPLLDTLREDTSIIVGENVPYTGELEGDCMHQHGSNRGLAHALIEIRQDLISTFEGQKAWAERLSEVMQKLLDDKNLQQSLHTIHHSDQAA
ncbi:MAG: N-formylglutamate amidohydrolase [Methyloligellaceae bacterium]